MNSSPHPPPYSYKKGNAISLTMISTQRDNQNKLQCSNISKREKTGGEWKAREKMEEHFFSPCNAF